MIENSESIFDELINTAKSGKSKTSLENVKKACDLIVASRGVMNYSRVALVATESFGGPKKQSIQNNKDLKRYISARLEEYLGGRKHHSLPSRTEENMQSKYPETGLSPRVKVYIDQLVIRLNLVEKRYQELRKQQEELTKRNPVSLIDAIEKGSTEEGNLILEYTVDNCQEMHGELKAAVASLLDLREHIKSLEVEVINGQSGLVLKRPAGDVVILDPKQYAVIQSVISSNGESKNC